jgi:hypothetical protein
MGLIDEKSGLGVSAGGVGGGAQGFPHYFAHGAVME